MTDEQLSFYNFIFFLENWKEKKEKQHVFTIEISEKLQYKFDDFLLITITMKMPTKKKEKSGLTEKSKP